MKRKYLSALLMGALTVTSVSTFTSCKDYDSDISNLQGQIDKAALLDDVKAMQTTVEAAKTTAEAAKAAAEKAQGGVDLTEIENKVKDLATQVATAVQTGNDAKAAADEAKDQCTELEIALLNYYTADEVDNLLKELEQKINGDSESFEELKETVATYKNGINALYSAVTGVSLVIGGDNTAFSTNLQFEVGTISTPGDVDVYTFGKDEVDDKDAKMSATPTKEYKKGGEVRFANTLLVRVNPVNANITKDMVKLVDAQGNDLSNTFDITKVERYNEQITKASSESGLWKVTLEVKEGVKNADIEKKAADGKHICYAVAVNNTASQAEAYKDAADRYVVSEYGVTIGENKDYSPATGNLGSVKIKAASAADWTKLSEIKNSLSGGNNKEPLYVQNGENIIISFEGTGLENADRFYVVRDDSHAGDDKSDASELNAWKKYDYKGLGEVVAVEKGAGKDTLQITIPADAKEGDEIQFRIFAINYDGSLVKAWDTATSYNGKTFRVYVGAQTTTAEAIGNAEFTGKEAISTGWQKITGSLKAGGTLYSTYKDGAEITLKDAITEKTFKAKLYLAADAQGTAAVSDDKVAYFKVEILYSATEGSKSATDLQTWTNEGLATATVTDAESGKLATNSLAIKVTKKMPTEEDAKAIAAKLYNWSAKQLVDGTYTAYLYPSTSKVESTTATASWNAKANFGYKYLKDAISSFGSNKDFVVTIANAAINAADDNKYTSAITADSQNGYVFQVGDAQGSTDLATLVDNETAHASTIGYNFGKISSVETAYGKAGEDFIVPIENYNTVFACALDETVQTYTWTKAKVKEATKDTEAVYQDMNVITYGNYWSGNVTLSDGKTIENVTDYIIGANSYDSSFKGSLKTLLKEKYVSYNVKLISDDTQKDDYFTASFKTSNGYPQAIDFTPKKVEASANPTEDVPSHLVITAKDAFGHEHVISLPFTVKRK